MAKVQFFSQRMIDQWVAEKKVEFDGAVLNVLAGAKGRYVLKPASMILDVVEGTDQKKLKGKVLTEEHAKNLKADIYLDSALIDEVAYKVEPGFIVDAPTPPQAPPPEPEKPVVKAKAEDTLADLMLKSLSGLK